MPIPDKVITVESIKQADFCTLEKTTEVENICSKVDGFIREQLAEQ